MAVEIDETRLNSLTEIARIADGLLKNPKARRKYLEAVKETRPDIPIPELDAAEPIQNDMKTFMEEIRGELKADRDARTKEREEVQISSVKREYEAGRQSLREIGYTEEGITDVEKFMTDNGIMNWDIARKAYEHDNPRPAPARPTRGNMFDFVDQKNNGDDYIKKLFETGGKDESVLDGQINTVLAESRQGLSMARAR